MEPNQDIATSLKVRNSSTIDMEGNLGARRIRIRPIEPLSTLSQSRQCSWWRVSFLFSQGTDEALDFSSHNGGPFLLRILEDNDKRKKTFESSSEITAILFALFG